MHDMGRDERQLNLASWGAQLRKGAVELAVLAILGHGESYGLALLDRLREAGGLDVSDGSIYPLLNRLQRDGKIAARWVEDVDASHPRKYYRLTADGSATLARMTEEWDRFESSMNRILRERVNHA